MKRKPRTIRNIVLVTAGVVTGLLMGAERPVGKETAPAIPKTATVIPAPREMRVTGGEYWAKKPPKMERVDGIPSEGYELSIRPDGMTIRYSDDAGAFAGCESLTSATVASGATLPDAPKSFCDAPDGTGHRDMARSESSARELGRPADAKAAAGVGGSRSSGEAGNDRGYPPSRRRVAKRCPSRGAKGSCIESACAFSS